MELTKYQEQAMKTCMESSNNVAYMMLNLIGEVGEAAEKMASAMSDGVWHDIMERFVFEATFYGQVAKVVRKSPEHKEAIHARESFDIAFTDEQKAELSKELGDIMWQLNGLMTVLGLSAEDVAQQNLDKLASRQDRNVIDGNGDNR